MRSPSVWTISSIGDAAHNGAVLKHVADSSGQPVFSIAFDFKYYFHQLWYAARQLPLMGMIMLEPGAGGGASARTGCYSEHVMTHGNGHARKQRLRTGFGNAILQAFCERMDSEEREFEGLESELVRAWLAARRTLQHDDYGTQAKLYDILQYTDDPVASIVGVDRTVRFLKLWHRMVGPAGANLMAAGEHKWHAGAAVT
jgi:hypothetical protein